MLFLGKLRTDWNRTWLLRDCLNCCSIAKRKTRRSGCVEIEKEGLDLDMMGNALNFRMGIQESYAEKFSDASPPTC